MVITIWIHYNILQRISTQTSWPMRKLSTYHWVNAVYSPNHKQTENLKILDTDTNIIGGGDDSCSARSLVLGFQSMALIAAGK
jgi:hypothetical protein